MILTQLAVIKETYRAMLYDIRKQPDRSFLEAVVADGANDIEEDDIVDVATILLALSHDAEREPQMEDILWAHEFIDHLDTIGKVIVPK